MQSGQQTHVLAFEVGGHPVAIRASEIAQIVPAATLCCDGADASVFRGVLNLRGVAIPVIDLMHVLGLGVTAVGIDSHILITRPAPASYGLLVDRVRKLVRLDASMTFEMRSYAAATTAFKQADAIVPIISTAELLLEGERQRAEALRQQQQSRLDALVEATA